MQENVYRQWPLMITMSIVYWPKPDNWEKVIDPRKKKVVAHIE